MKPLDLKSRRKALGMTQKEVALKAKVSQALIAKLELGTMETKFNTMIRVLKALKINVKLEVE